jgi:hypothetical protein
METTMTSSCSSWATAEALEELPDYCWHKKGYNNVSISYFQDKNKWAQRSVVYELVQLSLGKTKGRLVLF